MQEGQRWRGREGLSPGWSGNLNRNHTSEDEMDEIEIIIGDVDIDK